MKKVNVNADATATTNTHCIRFSELENYNDTESFVWLGLIMPTNDAEIKSTYNEITEWLLAEGFIKNGKVIDIKQITGNVLGKKGRIDQLVILSNGCSGLHPIKRLQTQDMKWTSDFIVNYAKDYGKDYGVIIEEDDYDEDDE